MAPSHVVEDAYTLWNAQIRELLVTFIIGSVLYGIAYSVINYFRRPITPGEQDRNTLSFILGCFGLAIAFGSMLLVPTTIITHDVLVLFPNNYYLQWLSRHLIYTLWNRIFWASNVSIFILLPLAYFYHEASGFSQGFKSTLWRALEAVFVWLLVALGMGGFIYLARSLYATSQTTPDYTPFAYSIMSLVGSVFVIWHTPGGIAVLGRSSINLFRTYKVLVTSNRQELMFEKAALRFKIDKLEAQHAESTQQKDNRPTLPFFDLTSSSPPASHFAPNASASSIWTKTRLVPTQRSLSNSSSHLTNGLATTPAQRRARALQLIASLQQQLLQNSSTPASADGGRKHGESTVTETVEKQVEDNVVNGESPSSASTDGEDAAFPFFGDSEEQKTSTKTLPNKTFDSHERIDRASYEDSIDEEDQIAYDLLSPEMVHLPRCRREGSIISPESISELSSLLQQQTSVNGLISPGNSLASGVKRVDWGISATRSRRARGAGDENLLPFVQEADWFGARDEHASATKRLLDVQQELRKYQAEPEKVTIMSSLRWMIRNLLAILFSTINLIVPMMLFIRAVIVHVRPYLSNEGVKFYYSFLTPDEESTSTIWFTAEIALFSYLTASTLTGLYHSGLLSHFKLVKHRTGMHKILVSIYITLVVASALPVTGKILGIISFDLMGNYDNMGYLKNSLLTYSLQILFAILLTKRYLEFFPWTNYVLDSIKRLFAWADEPIHH